MDGRRRQSASEDGGEGIVPAPAGVLWFVDAVASAAHALVAAGADMATARIRRPRDGAFVLVAAVGFPEDVADAIAVVRSSSSPCGAAGATGGLVSVPDLADAGSGMVDDAVDAVVRAGSRACMAFPVLDAAGATAGVVSAHYRTPGERPSDAGLEIVERIGTGHPLADALAVARAEVDQLRRAIETRDVISTAKGILMASSNKTEKAAFQMLVSASQRENVKLRDIAERIVNAHMAR